MVSLVATTPFADPISITLLVVLGDGENLAPVLRKEFDGGRCRNADEVAGTVRRMYADLGVRGDGKEFHVNFTV